jgi:hypothetical protein
MGQMGMAEKKFLYGNRPYNFLTSYC